MEDDEKSRVVFVIFLSIFLVHSRCRCTSSSLRHKVVSCLFVIRHNEETVEARPQIFVDKIGHVRDKCQMITTDIVANLL